MMALVDKLELIPVVAEPKLLIHLIETRGGAGFHAMIVISTPPFKDLGQNPEKESEYFGHFLRAAAVVHRRLSETKDPIVLARCNAFFRHCSHCQPREIVDQCLDMFTADQIQNGSKEMKNSFYNIFKHPTFQAQDAFNAREQGTLSL